MKDMSMLLKRKNKNKGKTTQKKINEEEKQDTISKDKLSIVIGANSPLGIYVVNELLERGRRVRIVVSNKKRAREFFFDKDIEIFNVNLRNVESVMQSIEKDSIVYYCVKTPFFRWFRDFPIIHYNIIHAVKKHEAKLVYVDNLTVYGKMKSKKLTEKDPLIPNSDEGALRKKLAEQVIIGDQRGDFQAVIVRFPDLYGPYVVNNFSNNVFERPIKKLPGKWYVDLNQPHSFIYIKDAAKALVNLAENPDTYGEVWHVAGPQEITGNQFIRMIYLELGKELGIKTQSKFWIEFLSFFSSELGRIKDVLEEWEYPFVIDGSKYYETFENEEPTPHREAIAETIEWFRERVRKQQSYKKYLIPSFYPPIRF